MSQTSSEMQHHDWCPVSIHVSNGLTCLNSIITHWPLENKCPCSSAFLDLALRDVSCMIPLFTSPIYTNCMKRRRWHLLPLSCLRLRSWHRSAIDLKLGWRYTVILWTLEHASVTARSGAREDRRLLVISIDKYRGILLHVTPTPTHAMDEIFIKSL